MPRGFARAQKKRTKYERPIFCKSKEEKEEKRLVPRSRRKEKGKGAGDVWQMSRNSCRHPFPGGEKEKKDGSKVPQRVDLRTCWLVCSM